MTRVAFTFLGRIKESPMPRPLVFGCCHDFGKKLPGCVSLVKGEEDKQRLSEPSGSPGWLARARISSLPRHGVQASPTDTCGRTFRCHETEGGGPPASALAASLAASACSSWPPPLLPASPCLSLPLPASPCLSLPGSRSLLLNDSHLPQSSFQNPQWAALRTPHVW